MKLFRHSGENFEKIEEVTLQELDLKHKKTLFIFPGAANPAPFRELPHDGRPRKGSAYEKIRHLIDIGTVYTQRAMRPNDEPYQVIVATWESTPKERKELVVHNELERKMADCSLSELRDWYYHFQDTEADKKYKEDIKKTYMKQAVDICVNRLSKEASDHVSDVNVNEKGVERPGYSSEEAEKFVDELYSTVGTDKEFDPNKISFLGWSYGTCFVQECANVIRNHGLEELRVGKDKIKDDGLLPPIYAVCVATVSDITKTVKHGFPGFYMYASNDEILAKYNSPLQKAFYDQLFRLTNTTSAVRYSKSGTIPLSELASTTKRMGTSSILIPKEREGQAIAVVTTPNHKCYFTRSVPVPWDEFRKGVRETYREPEFDPKRKKFFKPKEIADPTGHMPALYMLALEGSKSRTVIARKGIEDIVVKDAYEHTDYFNRCLQNILCRSEALFANAMLTDKSHDHFLGKTVRESDIITSQINNRIKYFTIENARRVEGNPDVLYTGSYTRRLQRQMDNQYRIVFQYKMPMRHSDTFLGGILTIEQFQDLQQNKEVKVPLAAHAHLAFNRKEGNMLQVGIQLD